MKKYKKILAALLTMTLVLGMSITGTAAAAAGDGGDGGTATTESATITIQNAEKATLTYVQVVEPDPTTRTGWKFCGNDDTIKNIFINAFKGNATQFDDQDAINALIEAQSKDVYDSNNVITNANTSAKLAKALDDVKNSQDVAKSDEGFTTDSSGNKVLTVSKAGIYAIQGTETGYTYNNMAAFVGFNEVTSEDETKTYPVLQDVTINAKKSSDSIDKTVDDTDKVVPVGSIVTYTIKTTVPNIATGTTKKEFKITDKLYGAEYYLDETGDTKIDAAKGNEVNAVKSVKMGDTELGATQYTWEEKDSGTDADGDYKTFTIDLSSLIDDANTNAGKEIVVTYTAVVNSPDRTKNVASRHASGVDADSTTPDVKTFSGQITLTKYAEDNDNDNLDDNEKLAGAGFKVYKTERQGDTAVTKWATFNDNNVFTGWAAATEDKTAEDNATIVTTTENGTLVVKGLELGNYGFKEVEAPKGYHINEENKETELKLADGQTTATATVTATTFRIDSKLSSLPSTGGIGTTIFTIGGCAIMIAAAFLFFASRKKKDEK